MTVATMHVQDAADHVDDVFGEMFMTVDAWRGLLTAYFSADAAPSTAALDDCVERFAVAALSGPGLMTGAGFVATPELLADARWHLSWWLQEPPGSLRRHASVSDPAAEGFRDYTMLEWWRAPVELSARHVTGPYVDYLCTDDYTVTITTPVTVGGRLFGVVGADVLVDRLERVLMPALRGCAAPAALVNSTGRVITATDSRHEPGSILRLEGLRDALSPLRGTDPGPVKASLAGGATAISCGESSLALIVGI